MMTNYNETNKAHTVEMVIKGLTVRLVFSQKHNHEIPNIIGNILKGAYLERQSV